MSERGDSRLVPLGRVSGHRGAHGEITVRVRVGAADFWTGVESVVLTGGAEGPVTKIVDGARGYRDRLVLKLRGSDDASTAAGLRGREVSMTREAAGRAAAGRLHPLLLLGLEVVDEVAGTIGWVSGVLPTAGTALLEVRRSPGAGRAAPGEDLLVPAVPEFVRQVDEAARVVRVRLPEGLLTLDGPEDAP